MADTYNNTLNETTITFSGFAGKLVDLSGPSMSRAAIDITSLNSAVSAGDFAGEIVREFMPGTIDMGEVSGTVAFSPEEEPPITGAAATLTITWPDTGTWACSAFLTSFEPSGTLDGHTTASFTFKLTGTPTYTAAA